MASVPISDDELTAQALAADPDAPLPADAVPFELARDGFGELLPDWYMPAPAVSPALRTRRNRIVSAVIVGSLLAVNAVGLCVTYGVLELAI